MSTTVLGIDEPKTAARTIFDLEGRGEAAAIEALIPDGTPEPLSTLKGLLGATAAPVPRTGTIHLDRPKARVVTNLVHRPFVNGMYFPGDRVAWSEVTVNLKTSAFEIVGYDKVDTGYETIDLGKLTRTANWTLSGTAGTTGVTGLTIAPTEATSLSSSVTNAASGTATAGETLTEEVSLRQRFTSLAVSLLPAGAGCTIVREGASGIDLTGSTSVDIQLEATAPKSTQVFTAEVLKSGGTLKLTASMATYAPCSRITLETTANAVIRHIETGSKTITESDDKVVHLGEVAAATQAEITLDPVVIYYVRYGAERVKIDTGGSADDLVFLNLDEARKVRAWLSQSHAQLAALQDPKYRFVEPGPPMKQLTFNADPGFTVEALVLNNIACP